MAALNQVQLQKLHRALEARYTTLIAEARQEMQRTSEGDQIEPLSRVLDDGDAAVEDLMATLDSTEAERHMTEVRAIIDAGNRLRHGTFGDCIDCGQEIGFERLEAMPTATRCVVCQELVDRNFDGVERPTL